MRHIFDFALHVFNDETKHTTIKNVLKTRFLNILKKHLKTF